MPELIDAHQHVWNLERARYDGLTPEAGLLDPLDPRERDLVLAGTARRFYSLSETETLDD